jgi:hypothetical protein
MPLTPAQPFVPFYKRKWFLVVILVVVIAGTTAALLRVFTPDLIPQTPQSNTWGAITPGKTDANKVVAALGQPINSFERDGKTIMQYTSIYPAAPNEVTLDAVGTVAFIKEQVTYDPNHTLSKYTAEFGQEDFSLFAPQISRAVKAHVFLKKGVVVVAHINTQAVQQKWYFVPTTQTQFMSLWGEDLKAQDAPESLNNQQ